MNRISLLAVLWCFAPSLHAADWPQWLGPRRDGSTPETIKPWKDAPKILWREKVGSGFSAPIIAGGKVYLHTRVPDKEEEQVIAFDANSGSVLWREGYPRPEFKSVLGTGPRATPSLSGKKLYSLGINGLLTCFDIVDGKKVWQVDLYKQFPAELPAFAVCCSPMVVGNRVIVSVGGKGQCVVALDAETGAVRWQALDDPASTSSPILFAGGARAVGAAPDVVFMTPLRLVALDPLDGTLRWEHPMIFQPQGTSPTPIGVGSRLVASTQAHGALAVQVAAKEEKLEAGPSWQNKEMKSYFSSGVTFKDRLFLVTNAVDILPSASINCLDATTGKQLWAKEGMGYFHAGVIRLGDGKLLSLSDSGKLSLLEPDDKGAKVLATATVCGGTLVAPTLSQGKLYVRDERELICLQVGE